MNQLHTKFVVESHRRSIAFSWFDNHMYLYESARWCQNMEPRPVRAPKPLLLRANVHNATKTLDGPYERIRPGHWYSGNLTYVRETMHSAGVVPRISPDPKGTEIHRLTVALNDGECVVTQVDCDSMDAINNLLEHFKITYTGQSLPAAVQTMLVKLMEPARQHLTDKYRR